MILHFKTKLKIKMVEKLKYGGRNVKIIENTDFRLI